MAIVSNNSDVIANDKKVVGNNNDIIGNRNDIVGNNNNIRGSNNNIKGNNNTIEGNYNKIMGNNNDALGLNNEAIGNNNDSYTPEPNPPVSLFHLVSYSGETVNNLAKMKKPIKRWNTDGIELSDEEYKKLEKYMEEQGHKPQLPKKPIRPKPRILTW